jgi:hypothetical protein
MRAKKAADAPIVAMTAARTEAESKPPGMAEVTMAVTNAKMCSAYDAIVRR